MTTDTNVPQGMPMAMPTMPTMPTMPQQQSINVEPSGPPVNTAPIAPDLAPPARPAVVPEHMQYGAHPTAAPTPGINPHAVGMPQPQPQSQAPQMPVRPDGVTTSPTLKRMIGKPADSGEIPTIWNGNEGVYQMYNPALLELENYEMAYVDEETYKQIIC